LEEYPTTAAAAGKNMKSSLALSILGWTAIPPSSAFSPIESRLGAAHSRRRNSHVRVFAEGFGSAAVKERPSKNKAAGRADSAIIEDMTAEEAKRRLVDLIPRMTGKEEEYRTVEAYVNLLEDKYSPVQTINFLNLAMSGDWQLVSNCDL
jgi:hypothetical protein